MLDPQRVKESSEAQISAVGGEFLPSLPCIAPEELKLRTSVEVAQRTLVLAVLVNLSFGMPLRAGHEWLTSHGLLEAASANERAVLREDTPLDRASLDRLRWSIEPLWAAAWTGGLVSDLSPTQPIADSLASLLPDLRTQESPADFLRRYTVRSLDDIYVKLDLFYRAHWYVRDCQLTGRNSAPFNFGIVQLRRQLLEWVAHRDSEWDDVDLGT